MSKKSFTLKKEHLRFGGCRKMQVVNGYAMSLWGNDCRCWCGRCSNVLEVTLGSVLSAHSETV